MTRNDFLEILKDYLNNHFSISEIDDILRDYEEFFLNGQLEGKTEDEIANSLGSPKQVANELIAEVKFKGQNNKENYAKENTETIKKKAKVYYSKAKKKTKDILNSDTGILNAKNIVDGDIPLWAIRTLIFLLSMMLIIPTIGVVLFLIMSGIGFVCASIGNVILYFVGFLFFSTNSTLAMFLIFMGVLSTGALIIGITIYINVIKLGKVIYYKYKNWVKRKLMYIKVRKNYNEKKNSEELIVESEGEKGGDKHEEN